jgi:hypothetical protein
VEVLDKCSSSPGMIVSGSSIKLPSIARNVVQNTENHAMSLGLIMTMNKKVHGPLYDRILNEV